MAAQDQGFRNDVATAIGLGAFVTALWILFTWRLGFDLADEGFYWYGAQRMLHGEVPLRDYMAYDLGRYAWTAAVMWLLGDDGILGARAGALLFQACTVVLGVFLALRGTSGQLEPVRRAAFAVLLTILLNLWCFPYYKAFDYGTTILMVAMLMLMFASTAAHHWFFAGVTLGLAAIMGRNHGLYGASAALLFMLYLAVKQERPAVLLKPAMAFICGTALGFSPTLVVALFVPGFGRAFVTSVLELVRSGSTNLGLPIPWPWRIQPDVGWIYGAVGVLRGMAFIALLLVPVVILMKLAPQPLSRLGRVERAMLCAALVGLPYAHYAFSRADLTHLSLAIIPLLLVLTGLGAVLGRAITGSALLLGVSLIMLAPDQPMLIQALSKKGMTPVSVNGTTLYSSSAINAFLHGTESIFQSLPPARDRLLVVPNAPGLYAIHKKKMPIWEIYPLFPRDAAFEAKELERLNIKPPVMVLLSNHALDERDELRYSRLHPLLYQWIRENYRKDPALSNLLGRTWEVYVAKDRDVAAACCI